MARPRHFQRAFAVLSAALVIVASSACSGGSASGGGKAGVVEYGGQDIVPDLVFRGKDWAQGYDVHIKQTRFPSGGPAIEALLAGDVNVTNGGSGRLITIAAQRPDAVSLVAKWQYGGSRYSVLVPPGSKIDKAADLKGKTVAVDKGSGAFTLFQKWLRDNGLKQGDVKLIQTKVSDIGSALEGGSADVGVAWEPTASILVHKKIGDRLTTLKSAGQSPNFLLVNKNWAESHHKEVVAFLRAAVDVGRYIRQHPATAGKMAARVSKKQGTQVDPAAMADALRHIEMRPAIDDPALKELTSLAKGYKEKGKIPKVPDFKSMVDNSYLNEAMKK